VFKIPLKTQRPNPLTGALDAVLVADKDRHNAPLRNVCWIDNGFIGVDPIPSPSVEDFYRKEYRESYKGTTTPQARHVLRAARVALHRLEQIAPVLPKILTTPLQTFDAGASSGEFVFLMQKLGHSACGLEAHEGYATHAKETLGLNISNGVFSEFNAGTKRFDLITLFHVLEHLEFPVADLIRLSDALHPEGLFVIEVPNILYRGMRFRHKWHAAHLNGFSLKTLEATARCAGLHPVVCTELGDGGNLFGIFRKGEKLSAGSGMHTPAGADPELKSLAANSDADYFLRPSTWSKIAPKLLSQLEERRTAKQFSSPVALLHSTYDTALRTLRSRFSAPSPE
jgi:2-polyprenyl-3-methyl-5-hydroxy-6-metoxy-1,4-benzoquinol methylase